MLIKSLNVDTKQTISRLKKKALTIQRSNSINLEHQDLNCQVTYGQITKPFAINMNICAFINYQCSSNCTTVYKVGGLQNSLLFIPRALDWKINKTVKLQVNYFTREKIHQIKHFSFFRDLSPLEYQWENVSLLFSENSSKERCYKLVQCHF